MKKIVLMFVSIFLLVSSFFLIKQLQISNFKIFNEVSKEATEEIKKTLQEKSELEFTALLCNEIRVPFDDVTNTFYVPLDMNTDFWETLKFSSGQPEFQVMFSKDITEISKQQMIAQGEMVDLLVFNDQFWANYHVVFTGLPIVDLATNEGFYAAEEITGTAVFYDVDFSKHGTQKSVYNGHIRGNTSRMFPKKGYKLNLTYVNEYGVEDGNKLSLFGMRGDDDWILYALYNDDTKLRDALSMEVWDRFGAKAVSENSYYGPKMTYVELFADNQYCGMYGLMEPVDAKQLNLAEGDYSYKRKNPGGLVYQYNNFAQNTGIVEEIEGFAIKDGLLTESAWMPMADLAAYITRIEVEDYFTEQDIINEDSAIRMWLFMQLITGHDHTAKNIFYVAKFDESLKHKYQFYFAPWDMDLTWGNVSVGEENPYYTEFEMETYNDRVGWDTVDWMIDQDFNDAREKVENLYAELRRTILTDDNIEEMIHTLDDQIRNSGAFERDKARWTEGIHADDCDILVEYAKKRLNFLDQAIYDFNYFE